MENYNINDAFKALEGLNEDIFSADDKGIEELRSFYDGDTDFEAENIIDVEAKTKEDLKDSYVGHVILRCPICTTLIYKLPKEVILDEDTAYVNVGEECPVCSSVDGWDIVGQVVDFDKESLNVEDEDDGEESDSDVKIKVDDEEVITESKYKRYRKLKEALTRNKRYRGLTEEKNSDKLKKRFPEYFGNIGGEARYKKDNHSRKMFKEAFGTIYDAVLKILDDNGYDVEDSEVKEYANSAAEYIEMTRAETDDKYSVYRWFKDTKSNYPEELTGLKKLNESVDSVEVKTDKEKIKVDSDEDGKTTVEVEPREEEDIIEGEETIASVDDETKDEIEDNSIKVSDTDIDIDEFDEDEFDELEEKYLQKVYENVKSYKTTKGTIRGNKLILEGVIEFNSGKKVPTKNIFESAYRLKNGKLKFNGLNEQFSKNNKAFTLTGTLDNKKLIIESLNYNYSAKDNKSGKTQRIYGTVKK